jgi:hypothetical protein
LWRFRGGPFLRKEPPNVVSCGKQLSPGSYNLLNTLSLSLSGLAPLLETLGKHAPGLIGEDARRHPQLHCQPAVTVIAPVGVATLCGLGAISAIVAIVFGPSKEASG